MRKNILAAFFILITSSFVMAQTEAPPGVGTPAGAGDTSLADNDIKLRSVELDRIKREAEKSATLRREDGKELNFSIVKDDFEGIQTEHNSIIEAYTKGSEINYPQISKSSNKITEMAVRLRGNVFFKEETAKTDEPTQDEENSYSGKSVRDLIVELDNAIGEVVSNPMWQKLAVVDVEVSKTVEASLVKVIDASGALWLASNKMITK